MRSVMALTVIPLLAALSACASFAPDSAVAVKQIGPDRAETLLTEAALRAERAFVALARARSAENPLADTPLPRIVPAALSATVTLDWTGPLKPSPRNSPGAPGIAFSPPDLPRPARRSSP